MTNRLIISIVLVSAFLLTACSTSTGALVARGVISAVTIFKKANGTTAERDALCNYYNEHRAEVEAVRTYAKANWQKVPEDIKPQLLAINEQLNACEAPAGTAKGTTASTLLVALRRAVAFYRELQAAGIL